MAIITKKIAFNRVETVKADHSFKCKIYIKVKCFEYPAEFTSESNLHHATYVRMM